MNNKTIEHEGRWNRQRAERVQAVVSGLNIVTKQVVEPVESTETSDNIVLGEE